MLYTAPMPFKEAIAAHAARTVLPTTGRTSDLQQFAPAVKRRAMMSATVTSVRILDRYSSLIGQLIDETTDQATARLEMKALLADMGYQPAPELAGGLQDLSSDDRINLVLETNVQTAQGYGWYMQGQQEDVLDEWPAQELYRAFGPLDSSKQRDWAARWERAGGSFFGGLMIALKDDPIWEKIGSSELFADGLGNPYPPFAFNSGMDVRDVSRDDAISLGLISADQQVSAQRLDFNDGVTSEEDVKSKSLRDALERSGLGHFQGDVFVFGPKGEGS